MADISKFKTPDGTTYNIKDTTARAGLSGKAPTSHTHTKSQITDFPTSLPANGGNADTVDGKHVSDFLQISDVIQFKSYNMKYNVNGDRVKYYSDSDELTRGIYFVNNTPDTIRIVGLVSASTSGPILQFGYGTNTYPEIQNTGVGREWYTATSIATTPTMYQMDVPPGKLGYYGVYNTSGATAIIHQITYPDFKTF